METTRVDNRLERLEGKIDALGLDFRDFAIANERRMSDLMRVQGERTADRDQVRAEGSLNRTNRIFQVLVSAGVAAATAFGMHFIH